MTAQRKHDRSPEIPRKALSAWLGHRAAPRESASGVARAAALPMVVFCLAVLLACPHRTAAGETIWGLTPYRVRLLVACDDTPELTAELQADLCEGISDRIDALLGAAWAFSAEPASDELYLAVGTAALIGDAPPPDFDSLPPELIAELAELDKLMILGIGGESGSELRLSVRELDVRTRRWGGAAVRPVMQTAKLRDAAVSAVIEAFAPLATIGEVEGKRVVLQPKAAELPLRARSLALIAEDEVFQPIVRYNKRGGKPPRITAIPWTFLSVQEIGTAELICRLHSGLRTPLSGRRRGRVEQFALAVRGPRQPSTLVLQSRTESSQLLGGYDVFSHPPDSKRTVRIGRTDHRGSIAVPPAEHPLRVLLVRNGGHTLARLPLVPGLEDRLTAAVPDDRGRLRAEGFISGLQEELVDMVSRREVLLARTRACVEDDEFADAKPLLDELQALPKKKDFAQKLADARKTITSADPVVQARIEALLNDTQKLLNQHLDEKPVEELAREIRKNN